MNTKAKYKICKRLGSAVFEKCQTQKFTLSEARTSKNRGRGRRPRALSDYGRQLLEKQKVRYTYGISEKQLSGYIKSATKSKVRDVTPTTLLLEELESRLDNTVYRTGLAKTRALARQMVSHGHITVNGKKVTIPSFKVTPKDVLSVREGSKARQLFVDLPEKLKDHQVPAWLTFDPKKMTGEVVSKPAVATTELTFEPGVVIEYYSR